MNIISDNYLSTQSSCYTLDIRNSTSIIRNITYGGKGTNKDRTRLAVHSELMMSIHEYLINKLSKLQVKEYYFDNTGDGHMCLLWDKTHAWTLMDVVCSISVFVERQLKHYRANYLDKWSKIIGKPLIIDFGIGIHSAGSLVYDHKTVGRHFGYGTVLNSSVRVESFTKNFTDLNILFTGNFKSFLSKQFKKLDRDRQRMLKGYKTKLKKVTTIRSDVKDNRSNGHLLYTISNRDRLFFSSK